MSQLGPKARRLFELARQQDEPSATTLRRVEASIASRLVRTAAIAAVSTTATKAAATAGLTLPWIKVITVASLTATLAGASWWGVRSRSDTLSRQAAVASVSRPSAPLPSALPELSASKGVAEDPQPAVATVPTPLVPRTVKSRALPAVSSASVLDHDDPLHAEIRDLRVAQQALRQGEGTRVLALLDQQDRGYVRGAMQEERTAARVLALCQIGRVDEARAAAEGFEQRWPKSSLMARLRNSCWTR
jgi:hypothetical protein